VCIAALLATALVGCGGSGQQGAPPKRNGTANVGQVLRRGESLGAPTVQGRVFPLNRAWFVLAGRRRSLTITARPALARRLGPQGTIQVVTGPVRRLDPTQAKQVEAALAERERRGRRLLPEITRAPRTPGTPYLEVQRARLPGKARPPR